MTAWQYLRYKHNLDIVRQRLLIYEAMQNFDSTRPNYVAPTPDAVTAKRKPVQAPRSQDADPEANDGLTRITEGAADVMQPDGGTQPTQPNPSSLRQ